MFSTPILFIVFNRPNIAQQSFGQIRKVKPSFLFVAADGPRRDRPDDRQKCEATRKIIEQIDWPCELKTLFRSENRGCGHGPAEAITWFFENVERGIILEDDCMADESFFHFCDELLIKYQDDRRVSMIGGTNPLGKWSNSKYSYSFSVLAGTWGWASWRRAWASFDYSAVAWQTTEGKKKVAETLVYQSFYRHFSREFDTYFLNERSDVWDFQWYFARLYSDSCGIIPSMNLISNIGFDGDGTHTFHKNHTSTLAMFKLQFPLKHPSFRINNHHDWYLFERCINPVKRPFWKKILLKLINLSSY